MADRNLSPGMQAVAERVIKEYGFTEKDFQHPEFFSGKRYSKRPTSPAMQRLAKRFMKQYNITEADIDSPGFYMSDRLTGKRPSMTNVDSLKTAKEALSIRSITLLAGVLAMSFSGIDALLGYFSFMHVLMQTAGGFIGITAARVSTFVYRARQHKKATTQQLSEALQDETPSFDEAGTIGDLKTLASECRGVLPKETCTQIDTLIESLETAIAATREMPGGTEIAYQVRTTALEYLPQTILTYLNIPKKMRDVVADGKSKSPTQLLQEQIAMLQDGITKDLGVLSARHTEALSANGRFIQETFRQDEA